jgi:hypothetical protein
MAQPPKQGIPPAPPTDPNAGRNIHGQPNYPTQPQPDQVNIPGQPPQPNMAPPEDNQSGLADNTRAEMEAGKRNLQQYTHRDDAEHDAGQKVLQQHASQK